jgi:hypothetical protein
MQELPVIHITRVPVSIPLTLGLRPATRAWAEKFDWKIIAEQYRAMYRDVLSRG